MHMCPEFLWSTADGIHPLCNQFVTHSRQPKCKREVCLNSGDGVLRVPVPLKQFNANPT
jgi:hypothetical protein